MIRAARLKPGDGVAIVAPSGSLDIISDDNIQRATSAFQDDFKLKVIIMHNTRRNDSIEARVSDLHAAFGDPNIRAIFTVIGGFNCNEILPHLDYELIRQNPKIFCGYSDITALSLAITSQTGLITYSGPHFSTMAMDKDETRAGVARLLFAQETSFDLYPSARFRDDAWYLWQEPLWQANEGHVVIRPGQCEQMPLQGGNLAVMSLLQGTRFLKLPPAVVLFLEWCAEYPEGLDLPFFTQRLFSLLQVMQEAGSQCHGLLFGRFQIASKISFQELSSLIAKLQEGGLLEPHVPIIANLDFGHTYPMHVIPLGGRVTINDEKITIYDQ